MRNADDEGVRDLRAPLLDRLIRMVAAASVLAYPPSAYLSIKHELWLVLVADTLAFGYIIVLALFPRFPYRLKLASLLVLTYGLGVVLVMFTGPAGAGPLFIFAFVFLTALFAEVAVMVMANVLALITYGGFAAATAWGLLAWDQGFEAVIVISANFVLVSLVLSTAAHSLIRGYGSMARKERDLRNAREVMLQEIEHRVKNNLQVISSLVALRSASAQDPQQALQNIQEGLSAIASVHQLLFRQGDSYLVRVPDLLSALVNRLGELHPHLTFHYQWSGPPVDIDSDRGVSLGVLVNEIVMNSVKHAFAPGAQGTIRIEGGPAGGGRGLILEIGDDGRGMPTSGSTTKGSGTRIVKALAQHIGATLTVHRSPGVSYRMTVPGQAPGRP